MRRNIHLAYWLVACRHSWFWLGIWVFYYLRFTNYAGIGLIETVLIVTLTVMEIPTGAIADLLGKKNTLITAFILEAAGGLMMAFAPSFLILVASVFVMCVGGALYSGSLEALIYDSLKQLGDQDKYDKIISNVNSLQWIVPAMCSVAGGFMYLIWPGLPFLVNAVVYFIGALLSAYLIEPVIDTDIFSLSRYWKQMRQGFIQLTKTGEIRRQTMILLSIGFIVIIVDEMLNSFLGFEFGFNERQLGILTAGLFSAAAAASQLTPWLRRKYPDRLAIFIIGAALAMTLIISPMGGLVLGGTMLLARSSLQAIFGNFVSIVVNHNTESHYRATTLSTFNMIKNIPYVLGAYAIGLVSDFIGAANVAFWLGMTLMVVMVWQWLSWKRAPVISANSSLL